MRSLRFTPAVCSALFCLLGLGVSQTAQAQELKLQEPAPRQGYYIGGGLRSYMGGGSADKVGSLGFMNGFGFAFRFGQMATEKLGLGLFISAGGSANKTWSVGGGNLSLEVMFKPLKSDDLALRGSIGLGAFGAARVEESQETEDDPSGGLGALYTIGASYDLFPWYEKDKYESGGFAFTGFGELQFLPTDEVWTLNFVVGLEVTYWFGLAKNKLELPADEAYKFEED